MQVGVKWRVLQLGNWILVAALSVRCALLFLVRQLGPPPGQPKGMIVVSFFPDLTCSSCEGICQMFFERFTILKRPATQIYTLNALNSLEARVLLGRYFRSLECIRQSRFRSNK